MHVSTDKTETAKTTTQYNRQSFFRAKSVIGTFLTIAGFAALISPSSSCES
jgi:hypothetical protein